MHTLTVEGGISDSVTLAAAVLHDTIEDTNTTHAELAGRFGREVADVVAEVTDDKSLDKHVRKQRQVEHSAQLSARARLVNLADKVSYLRDILGSPPHRCSEKQKSEYFDWAARAVAGLRGVHPKLEAVFEGLMAQRP